MTIFYVFWGGESENSISFYPSRLDFAVPEVVIFDTNDTKWHKSYFLILCSQHLIIMTVMAISYVFWGGESDNGIYFYPSWLDFAVLEVTICTQMAHNDTNNQPRYIKMYRY